MKPELMKIRQLQKDDGLRLNEFFEHLTEKDKYYFYPHPLDIEHAKQLAEASGDEDNIRFVATEEAHGKEEIIGYTYIARVEKSEDWSFGIAIRGDSRSSGLGTKLLSSLIEKAKTNGVKRIKLTVHKENELARRLYEKYGFRITGEFITKKQKVQYRMLLTFKSETKKSEIL